MLLSRVQRGTLISLYSAHPGAALVSCSFKPGGLQLLLCFSPVTLLAMMVHSCCSNNQGLWSAADLVR